MAGHVLGDKIRPGVKIAPNKMGIPERDTGAYLVDARSLFSGHFDWIDPNGLDASAKGHAALAAEYERIYESLPPALRLP